MMGVLGIRIISTCYWTPRAKNQAEIRPVWNESYPQYSVNKLHVARWIFSK